LVERSVVGNSLRPWSTFFLEAGTGCTKTPPVDDKMGLSECPTKEKDRSPEA